MNELGYQFGIAVAIVHLINWLKNTKLVPWVTAHSATINRVIAFAGSVIGGLGVHAVMNGSLTSGGTLMITYPPLDAMVTSFAHIAASWGIQKLYFELQKTPARPLEMSISASALSRSGASAAIEAHTDPVK